MPGSLLTFTVNKSIRSGARAGLIIPLGHALVELCLLVLLLAGAGSLLSSYLGQLLVGLIGGAALLFLAAGMFRDLKRKKLSLPVPEDQGQTRTGLWAGGIFLSVSNPYFLIWWSVVGLGLILQAYGSYGLAGVLVFYLGHILADISWYSILALLVSRARRFFSLKLNRLIVLVLALCLAALGRAIQQIN